MRMNLEGFQTSFDSDKIYSPDQITELLQEVRPNFRFAWTNKKLKYFNVPAAFDIETSSFTENGEKRACMYEWTFGLYGAVVIGRTWGQFVDFINRLSKELLLTTQKRLLVYCHNLAFEFQWLRKYFIWEKVFSLDLRKPLYALTDNSNSSIVMDGSSSTSAITSSSSRIILLETDVS